MSLKTHFFLNNTEIRAGEHAGMTVLDYIRKIQRLTGTKEGCREGDCGACAVLVGELDGELVLYKPVTSCLMPLGELHGKHLVTVEGLNMPRLSPVQQAIVNEGATQCGFCTPGIVVSLTGYLMDDKEITTEGMKNTLGGHLCRCTGYRSLKRGIDFLKLSVESRTGVRSLVANGMLPPYFLEMPDRLRMIPKLHMAKGISTPEFFIAGGTDLYVQKGDVLPESEIRLLTTNQNMKGIAPMDGYIRVGALTTFEAFANHTEIIKLIPDIQDYMSRIASLQIRNRATVGGNVVNASPVGDVTILLLALGATLVLKSGERSRTVPITAFFKGYKQLDMTPSEILSEIHLPIPAADTKINFEKVSKRKHLDVASVNSAMKVRCEGAIIREIALTMGGVAPIPLFLKATCLHFLGKQLCRETIEDSYPIVQQEISPISDIRGSTEYKRLLARQLLIAHFVKLFPDRIKAGSMITGFN
ncbi:MAG: FAD binding domain-containing protein [Planctomycetes bacterium]|nr:FAD binding domain-containing protein [Planctomycetota bacterium]